MSSQLDDVTVTYRSAGAGGAPGVDKLLLLVDDLINIIVLRLSPDLKSVTGTANHCFQPCLTM